MKKSLFVCAFIFGLSIAHVYAHESKESDGTIVYFHANPSHLPIEDEKSSLLVLIRTKDGTFPASTCDCRLTLYKESTRLESWSLFLDGKTKSLTPYIFKDAGIYRAEIIGTPRDGTSFSPFTFSFSFEVGEGDSWLSKHKLAIIYTLGGLVVFAVGLLTLY